MATHPEFHVSSEVPYDHSTTYRDGRVRNTPHRARLRSILSLLETVDFSGKSYADVGCSNGFLTSLIYRRFRPVHACGLDHNQLNLERARAEYPGISFQLVNLSQPICSDVPAYDVVTCFETLEHVGDLRVAMDNLLHITRPGGILIISVPIEIGPRGVLKFAAKLAIGYRLHELPQANALYWRYASSLLCGRRLSAFREQRAGWGTHFGFDYRDVDDILLNRRIGFNAWNKFTTRLYRATP
jgi:SAM-dependent methyltransferase